MAQSFTDVLSQIRGGFALNQAGEKLQEVIKAVQATGKKGTLTVTIDVIPDKVDERVLKIQPSMKVKIPEKGFNEGIFFVDDKGKLSREDPAQAEMFAERERNRVASLRQNEQALTQVGRGPSSS